MDRLLKAAEDLLVGLCASGEFGPADHDMLGNFPRDEKGEPWFPDVWELKQAVDAIKEKN